MTPFQRYQASEPITEALFREMCKAHDLTYSYSDDSRAYRAGRLTYDWIEAAAKNLGRDKAVPIWNSVVDEKLKDGFRADFYWIVE